MKCPVCSLEMEDGIIEAGASLLNLSAITKFRWVPKDEENDVIPLSAIPLKKEGKGWYCKSCKRAFGEFVPFWE